MTPRRLLLALVGLAVVVLVGLAATGGEDDPPRLAPGRGLDQDDLLDPLAYREDRREELEARAALGVSHVLFAKSPGGVVATALRVDRLRPLVDRAARAGDVDPEILEAIVFLESAGRPDAQASDDLGGAAGLTQILAQTGRDLLGMRIDVAASERLTRGIRRGRKVRQRTALRRRLDERFDPAKALAATVRYLRFAKGRLGRDDLAVVSYHMGVGNLQRALGAYGEDDIPYAQLFFDSTPLRHADAWDILASLGDDSSTYLWRVHAARHLMRVWRKDPAALARLATRALAKNSREEILHPPDSTPSFADPFSLGRARAAGDLEALDPQVMARSGLRIDRRLGEAARALNQSPRLYRALRREALAVLLLIGSGVREIAGQDTPPLRVTSAARDVEYQQVLLRRGNGEAARTYSLHTTGWAFDVARAYATRAQALAFQFWLDRLQVLDLIAWVREPGAIHVTVSRRARELVAPVLR